MKPVTQAKVSFKKKYWNKKKPMLSPTTIKQTKRQLKSKQKVTI